MLAQKVEDGATLWMIFRQNVEHFAHGEDSPTVGSSPMESRVRVHGFYPSVAEEFLFFHPHFVFE